MSAHVYIEASSGFSKSPQVFPNGEIAVQAQDNRRTPDELVSTLAALSFFAGLPEEDLRFVAGIVQEVALEEGEYLFQEGDPGDAFFVLETGGVELAVSHAEGQEEKLSQRRPGEIMGEMALASGSPRSFFARATESALLFRIDRDGFGVMVDNPRFARRVLESLARDQRALDLRVSAQGRLDAKPSGGGVDVREMSRVMQRGLLPEEAPRLSGFDIAAGTRQEPDGAGRTIWDYFRLGDGRTGLVILNVQGEGLPAGHYLAIARSLFRELAKDHQDLQGLLARVNSGLAVAVVEEMDQFVEAGVLLPSEGGVEWAGAGRCPGAIIRRSGVFEEFSTHGPPLGMLEGFMYGTQRMELGVGDAVIVFSEAPQGIFRGAADLVASLQGKPVGEIVSTVQKALKKAQEGEGSETSVLFIRKQ
jgi:CRP-like cAMP-binding protein